MTIQRNAEAEWKSGPADYFTGAVTISGSFQREAPARVGGATVHFAPGARTAWHTHPLGQTLIVTEGAGWIGWNDGRVEAIAPGDVVLIPPGVRHWHGATRTTGMTHVAVAEAEDGSPVAWAEQVSDADYHGPAG